MPELLGCLLGGVETEGLVCCDGIATYEGRGVFHFESERFCVSGELVGVSFHFLQLSLTFPPYTYIIGGGVNAVFDNGCVALL